MRGAAGDAVDRRFSFSTAVRTSGRVIRPPRRACTHKDRRQSAGSHVIYPRSLGPPCESAQTPARVILIIHRPYDYGLLYLSITTKRRKGMKKCIELSLASPGMWMMPSPHRAP